MSGGSMDYLYRRIEDAEFELTTPERVAFKKHLDLVAMACKAIEWVDSGDNSDGKETQLILNCINNVENVLITKEGLTPLLRRHIINLYNDSSRIVEEDVWDLIDEDKFEEATTKINSLKEIWGDDPTFQQAEGLIDRFTLLKDE